MFDDTIHDLVLLMVISDMPDEEEDSGEEREDAEDSEAGSTDEDGEGASEDDDDEDSSEDEAVEDEEAPEDDASDADDASDDDDESESEDASEDESSDPEDASGDDEDEDEPGSGDDDDAADDGEDADSDEEPEEDEEAGAEEDEDDAGDDEDDVTAESEEDADDDSVAEPDEDEDDSDEDEGTVTESEEDDDDDESAAVESDDDEEADEDDEADSDEDEGSASESEEDEDDEDTDGDEDDDSDSSAADDSEEADPDEDEDAEDDAEDEDSDEDASSAADPDEDEDAEEPEEDEDDAGDDEDAVTALADEADDDSDAESDEAEEDDSEEESSSAGDSKVLAGAVEHADGHDVWRGYIETFDGKHLFYARWSSPEAEDSERPVIALMHGYGEHVERYHEWAAAMVAEGYPVCGIDARGHGQSDGRRGYIEGFEDYVLDLKTLFAHLSLRYPKRPIALFGHSNGGLIAIHFAVQHRHDIVGLVLSGPSLGLRLKVPMWKEILGKVMSRIYPTLSMPNGIDAKDVSRSPEVVAGYDTDPLVNHNATARFFTEMNEAHAAALRRAGELELPVIIYQGGADKLTDPDASRRFFDALASQDKSFELLPDHYHEVFFEPSRAELRQHLLAWLSDRFSA